MPDAFKPGPVVRGSTAPHSTKAKKKVVVKRSVPKTSGGLVVNPTLQGVTDKRLNPQKERPAPPPARAKAKPVPKTNWRYDPGGGYVEQNSGRTVPEATTSKERAAQKKAFRLLKRQEAAQNRRESVDRLRTRWAREDAAAERRAEYDRTHTFGFHTPGLPIALGWAKGAGSALYGHERSTFDNIAHLRLRRELEHELDLVVGKSATNALMHGDTAHPWASLAEAALIPLPGKGLPSLLTKAGRAAFGAREAAQAVKAGKGVRAAAASLDTPLLERVGSQLGMDPNDVSRLYRHVWSPRLKQWVITPEPSARSMIGRGVEHAAEVGRKYVHQTPLSGPLSALHVSRTGEEKIMEELARSSRQTTKPLLSADAKEVVRLGKRLSKEQQYALVLIAEGGGPEAQAQFAEGMAKEAMAHGNKLGAAANQVHAGFFRQAGKYVEQAPDGTWHIAADAPENLKRIEAIWPRIQGVREDIYASLGILDPEQMANRIQQPGRLVSGARRANLTEADFYDLSRSPHRARIEGDLRDLGMDEQQVQDFLTLHDAATLNLWKQNVKKQARELTMLRKAVKNGDTLTDEQRARYAELRRAKKIGFENTVPKDLYYSELGAIWRGFPRSVRAQVNYEDVLSRVLSGALPNTPENQAATQAFIDAIEHGGLEDLLDYFKLKPLDHGPIVRDELARSRRWARSATSKKNYLPAGYKTPAKFGQLVDELFKRAVEGLPFARHWYRDSGQAILRASGGDLQQADRLAALTAIYSPQQSVVPNIGLALRVYEEFQLTGEVTIGQPWQKHRAAMALNGEDWRAGMTDADGIKIRNFYGNLLKHIDPELMRARGYTGREVTSDGWMGAAFKYGDNTDTTALNPQQHRLIERVTQKIADHLGIEPEEAQAAIWTSIKAERDRWLKDLPKPEALARAGTHFEEGLVKPTHQVRFAFEAASQHIPEYATWSPDVQQAFLEANADAVLKAFQDNGFYAHLNDYGIGVWIGDNGPENNPAVALEIAIGQRPKGVYEVTPEQQTLYDGVAAVVGKNLMQDGAGWLRPLVPGAAKNHTYYRIAGDFTPEQKSAFADAIGDVGYVTQTNDGLMAVRYDPESVLDGGESNKDFFNTISEAGKTHLGDGVTVTGGTHRGGYLDSSEYGLALERGRSALDSRGRPDLLGGVDRDLSAATEDIRSRFVRNPEDAARDHQVRSGAEAGAVGGRERGSADSAIGADFRRAPNYRDTAEGAGGITYTGRGTVGAPADVMPPEIKEAFFRDHPDATNFLAYIAMGENVLDAGTGDLVVWHEMAHYMDRAFKAYGLGKYKKALAKISLGPNGHDPEIWAESLEQLLVDPGALNLPKDQKEALTRFGAMALDLYDHAQSATQRLPEAGLSRAMPNQTHAERTAWQEKMDEVRSLFELLLTYENAKRGTRFIGAEDFKEGRFYLPLKRGLPVSWRQPIARARAYRHAFAAMVNGGGKSAMTLRGLDREAQKQWLGFLKSQGYWKGNATEAIGEAGIKAARLGTIADIRQRIVPLATEVPVHADDLPVVTDLATLGQNRPELRRALDLLEDMELGKRKISYSEVNELDAQILEALRNDLSPSQIEGMSPQELIKDMMNNGPRPIDGIGWVSRDGLEAAGILASPASLTAQKAQWTAEYLGRGFDTVNNAVKLTMLQLNPAYYTMNFLGNSTMQLMQQGVFAGLNTFHAAHLSSELGEDLARLVDDLMGSGVQSIATMRWAGDPLKHANFINELATAVVDRIPRRAAWLHEARRMGYKDPESLKALLEGARSGDRGALDMVDYISRRGRDALVDYDRLNEFEKKYVTRIIMFYPWIKGATRYTLRFPLEHPVQAMVYAGLFYAQQQRAQAELGDRPWYSFMEVPVGHVTRAGQEYPYTFNPKQLFTMTTPIEQVRAIEGFVMGMKNRQPLVETLTPVLQSGVEALAGRNSFEGKDQPQTIGSFFRGLLAPPAIVKKVEDLLSNEGIDPNRLYPRNELDKILSVALGSLAPKPYNAEKGQYYARGHKGTPPRAKELQNLADFEAAFGPLPSALKTQVTHEIDLKAEYGALLDKAHEAKSNLSEAEIGKIKLELALREHPELAQYKDEALAALNDPTTVNTVVGRLDKLLWGSLEGMHRRLNEYNRRKAKADQEAGVVSATG